MDELIHPRAESEIAFYPEKQNLSGADLTIEEVMEATEICPARDGNRGQPL